MSLFGVPTLPTLFRLAKLHLVVAPSHSVDLPQFLRIRLTVAFEGLVGGVYGRPFDLLRRTELPLGRDR